MAVTFFWADDDTRQRYDRRVIRFNTFPHLPAPPQAFIYEHFRQAVLANMRGAGQPPNLDYDPTDDAQTMSVFESGNGKEWLETELAGKLIPGVDDLDTQRSTQASPGLVVS
jgi:hypothetical protein